jgi:hypothetical protein
MRKLRIALVLLTVLVLAVLASSVGAQGQANTNAPGAWASSINLQNVGNSTASITIQFFDSSGNEIVDALYTPEPLAPNGAVSIYVPALVTGLNAGQYSAVVSSDQPVLASVNTASTGSTNPPWTSFAYDGFDSSQAGTVLFFPGNYKNYYGFFSEIVIQNAGNQTATLKGTFKTASGAVIASNVAMGTLAPNASKTFPMTAFAQLPSGNTNGLFGATITSDESVPLVGVANIWRTAPTAGTASYSGFTQGGTTLYPPALYKNYYGFGSALTIQNVGTGVATGTITYSNGVVRNFSLQEAAAQEFFQPADAALPSGNTNGVFAAKVVASAGQVVGLVSLSIPAGTNGDFASYNVPAAAGPAVRIANINSDYYGFFSAVTVQNTAATSTNVTITYANGSSRTFNNVAAGAAVNIIHLNSAGDILPNQTSTSATVTSSNNNPLVAVVQHNTAPGVNGYNPAKVPSDFLLAVTGVAN